MNLYLASALIFRPYSGGTAASAWTFTFGSATDEQAELVALAELGKELLADPGTVASSTLRLVGVGQPAVGLNKALVKSAH